MSKVLQCPCGSEQEARRVYDARGIYLTLVCDACEDRKLRSFRRDVLSDPHYWADEPIEEDE